jgi:adenine deaminase
MARPPASPHTLAVARGDEPADLLICGGRVFADATREWIDTALAIADGVIAGWGERDALHTIDVDGAALTPGFVDAHMHLESTKLWIDEFVATVLPLGTTAVAADPHELANVLGIPGGGGARPGGRAAADHVRDLRVELRAGVAVRALGRGPGRR